jgi:hypothetical protein
VFGDISFTPERHDGYPDEGIVMVEANSRKNGALTLAAGYGADSVYCDSVYGCKRCNVRLRFSYA